MLIAPLLPNPWTGFTFNTTEPSLAASWQEDRIVKGCRWLLNLQDENPRAPIRGGDCKTNHICCLIVFVTSSEFVLSCKNLQFVQLKYTYKTVLTN